MTTIEWKDPAESLWTCNSSLISQNLNCTFIQGLLLDCQSHLSSSTSSSSSPTLPLNKYLEYLSQDTYYLQVYARAYAYALARCEEFSVIEKIKVLLDGVFEELKYHQLYLGKYGLQVAKKISKETGNYVDFLISVAKEQPVQALLAAVIPCTRLYLYLGTELKSQLNMESLNSFNNLNLEGKEKVDKIELYFNWIEKYSSDGLRDVCHLLESLFNDLVKDADEELVELCKQNYKKALQLELEFFEQVN
ncbi:heme oxygenase-like protein [Neoconidiobolus thromboides FSU 785]|nr:heme oxygenase-like protein [Neoconidiobolus thromboides FSU 785]